MAELMGMRPINVDQIPDQGMLIQMAFRHGDKIYNLNMIGDTAPLVVSAKARGIILMNLVAVFIGNAAKIMGLTADMVDAPDPSELQNATIDEHLQQQTDLSMKSSKFDRFKSLIVKP